METSSGFEALQISGVAPNIIRELSGIYPTFVSAFKELVSNAYDADATLVTIRLPPDLSTITVEDNGVGMTPFEFQNEYIRIGGSAQRRDEDLTAGGRRPIGRKGIGFLAVARYCRLVEVHSHADRVVTLCASVVLEPQSSVPESRRIPFFQGAFAHALASFTTVQAVRCGAVELTPAEYSQDGLTVELSPDLWRRFKGQTLTVQYTVDCRAVDLQATIDYDYLLSLEDNRNLEALQDFCRVRLVPTANAAKPAPSAGSGQAFTRVTLHLREFARRELQAPQRRGRVRNVASASGLDQFLWHLSRSVPVAYDLSLQQLQRHGLEALAVPISPTPFAIRVTDAANETRELKRPLLGGVNVAALGDAAVVRQPVRIESDGLAAQGYLLGFPQPIFPAELRGIAIRVRGVEIGKPDFLGVDNDLPVKYRPFLSQVMGEIIVTEGLDALSAIMPGREGFYAENVHARSGCSTLCCHRRRAGCPGGSLRLRTTCHPASRFAGTSVSPGRCSVPVWRNRSDATSRYYHGPGPGEPGCETAVTDRRYYGPPYAILTTTRGCPFNCVYCAQHAYNLYDNEQVREALWTDEQGQRIAVCTRGSGETLREIRDKFHRYGIRQFAFYEDNFLIERDHFRAILEGIVSDPDLRGNVHLHAPEGVEVRLIDASLARLMRQAGFERVYLPLENINADVIKSWNRSHSNVQMFERAVQNCLDVGFILRNMQVNAFILFGTPGEDIRDVVDSVIFASGRIGSMIPMLFTPVGVGAV